MKTIRNILLTGATGFIGQRVLEELKKDKKNRIKVITRGINNTALENNNIEVIKTKNAFTESMKWWEDCCNDIDLIIHLAWYVEPGKYLNSNKNFQCISGTTNLVRAAKIKNVKKFVGIGTCFEYDLSDREVKTVDSKLKPRSLYAASKLACFHLISNFYKNTSIDFLWLRLFYLYGEGESEKRFYGHIVKQLKQDKFVYLNFPDKVRDYLEISEASKKITNYALSKAVGVKNICSGRAVTLYDFAYNIAKRYNKCSLIKVKKLKEIEKTYDPDFVLGKD
jgi:dTDP-6-deoxy-L-talose 4-dehydrogenase (NAD+)